MYTNLQCVCVCVLGTWGGEGEYVVVCRPMCVCVLGWGGDMCSCTYVCWGGEMCSCTYVCWGGEVKCVCVHVRACVGVGRGYV